MVDRYGKVRRNDVRVVNENVYRESVMDIGVVDDGDYVTYDDYTKAIQRAEQAERELYEALDACVKHIEQIANDANTTEEYEEVMNHKSLQNARKALTKARGEGE